MNNLKIAWRNLWRNKRRTMITSASIFFGVIFSTIMSSMQEGSYSTMVDNIVKFYSGYIQVFNEDYWDKKTINNTYEITDSLIKKIEDVEEITHYAPRLESFALASSSDITKGTLVIGIDPEKEDQVTGVSKWLTKGSYLKPGDQGVLLASDLAKYLQLDVNDTLILIGQGFHGISAAGIFPVRGILEFSSPELNKVIYMELSSCQEFYSAYNLVTSLVIMLKDHYDIPIALKKMKESIQSPYDIMTWAEMQPEIVQLIGSDRAGGVILKIILYMIIGFGIFGTIIMMIQERRREMGVMVAIGMQRIKLGNILFLETILIGLVGVFTGILGSIPLIGYYFNNPIRLTGEAAKAMIDMGIEPLMTFSWMPSVFYNQALTIFILTLFMGLYPVYKTMKLRIDQALRA